MGEQKAKVKEEMKNQSQETTEVEDKVTADKNTDETAEKPEAQEEAKEKTTEEKLAEAEAEIAELKTKALYRQAEFENFRKRVMQEKADLILNGGKKAFEAILPIVDDFERALEHKDSEEATISEGIELIYKKLVTTLKNEGVVEIDTKDADFNTDFHEAIAQIPAPSDELKGKVLDCTKKGYLYNEKVLRFAQVVVGV